MHWASLFFIRLHVGRGPSTKNFLNSGLVMEATVLVPPFRKVLQAASFFAESAELRSGGKNVVAGYSGLPGLTFGKHPALLQSVVT